MSKSGKLRFARPELLPSVITLAALAVLLGLGFWQLDRLEWKQAAIAKISAQSLVQPVPAPPYLASWDGAMEYRPVTATGIFRHDLEVAIYALGPRGAPGYHILTPLERTPESAGTVLVNRGWVAEELKLTSTRAAGLIEGTVDVEGVLRMPGRPSDFTPDNRPAEDAWFWPDMSAIAEARGIEKLAGYVITVSADPDAPGPPYGGATRLQIKNDHLQYALTWFSLALVLMAIFVVYHVRRPD